MYVYIQKSDLYQLLNDLLISNFIIFMCFPQI